MFVIIMTNKTFSPKSITTVYDNFTISQGYSPILPKKVNVAIYKHNR